ncbi:hypothetical protein [Nonomuraea dietziae]
MKVTDAETTHDYTHLGLKVEHGAETSAMSVLSSGIAAEPDRLP